MALRWTWGVLGLALALNGCASTHYLAGNRSDICTGKIGVCSQVNQFDVWEGGAPNHPYRVIGLIEDDRKESAETPSPETKDKILRAMIAEAREAKADAIVILAQYHTIEQRTSYLDGPPIPGATHTESGYGRDGNQTREVTDPSTPTYINNGTLPTTTDNLQTRAQAILYEK